MPPDQEGENGVARKMKMPDMMEVGHSRKWSESDVRGGGGREVVVSWYDFHISCPSLSSPGSLRDVG